MEKTKLFRIASIFMLIVGVLGLITSGSQLLYLTELSIGYTTENALVETADAASVSYIVVVALGGAALRLAAGLVGLRAKDCKGKFTACLVLCLLVIALSLVVKIVDLITVFSFGMLTGVLISLIIPLLYLFGLLQSRIK